MSTRAEERIHNICRKLEKQAGRMLKEGERVQEGDLLCCMPDNVWIPTAAPGLIISSCDVGWYFRPAKGARN